MPSQLVVHTPDAMKLTWTVRVTCLSLPSRQRESYESCLEVLRDLVKRGLQTPVTITTDGAAGLIKAVDFVWPRSLRIQGWFHKTQNLMQKVPPQAWAVFKALVLICALPRYLTRLLLKLLLCEEVACLATPSLL
jgi:transposase-like protein